MSITGPLHQLLFLLPLYVVVSLLISWLARRHRSSANDYLNATHALPLWIVVPAYIAANCGALEVVGLSAMAAQYGAQAFHFYWIAAVPAMIFLALWMMPVYRRNGISSVPQYLLVRFGPRMRLINACATAITVLLLAGISLYALAQVLNVILGISFHAAVLLCAFVVCAYLLIGGIRAAIYNEFFQLAVLIAGLAPLAIRSAHILAREPDSSRMHLWTTLPFASNQASLDIVGVVFGLGAILSFSYWCTDFVLMQRAFTARTEREACQVPLWAGFGKLTFSYLIVIPGLAAFSLVPTLHGRYDQALPTLMKHLYSPTMLAIGLTGVVAGLLSNLAANITAFAALFTQDIYRTTLRPNRTDTHYLNIARIAIISAGVIAIAASQLNFLFSNLMEHIQLIFAVLGAPFWGTFLLGLFSRRMNERGAITGFLAGCAVSFTHLLAVARHWIHYGSTMNSNFHAAIYAFTATLLTGYLVSAAGNARDDAATLHFDNDAIVLPRGTLAILAAVLLVCGVLLNIIWR